MNRIFMISAFVCVCSATGVAGDRYRTRHNSGNWHDTDVWQIFDEDTETWSDTTGHPGAGDQALVTARPLCLIQDETIGELIIGDGSTAISLVVAKALTIDGSYSGSSQALEVKALGALGAADGGEIILSSTETHVVDGLLQVRSDNLGMIAKLSVTASLSITGTGEILVLDDGGDAEVAVSSGKTLTIGSGTTLKVQTGLVTGPGTLKNNGTVTNTTGTAEFGSNLPLLGSGSWSCSGSNATINFRRTILCTGLTGDFSVANCGTMNFFGTVRTTGDFSCVTDGSPPSGGVINSDILAEGSLIIKCNTIYAEVIDEDDSCGSC